MQSEGERRQRSKAVRRSTIYLALAGTGSVMGFYGGFGLAHGGFDWERPWSPVVSILFTAVFLIAVATGSVMLARETDEVQRQTQYKAAAVGGATFMIAYPAWFFLWKGGFLPEPIHWLLFIFFWLATAASLIFYRFR